ncbi:MAG TPA: EAL domain-containing protein [Gallionella sp.]|nr:EAL domain-containing protein [Gallionella sp.]
MKTGRSILVLFMLPVLLAALVALLINYWSLHSLREQHEQSSSMESQDVALLTEAARLSEDMAVVQRRVAGALEAAEGRRLDEGKLYLVHSGVVNDLAALNKRVLALSESAQVREVSPKDALALPEQTREYGNYVIMATEIAAVDPGTAIRYVGRAQQHFIAFSEHAHRISAMLANRTVQRNDEAAHAFDRFFSQLLALGLAGMLSIMLLAVLSASKISRRMADVADALWQLSQGGDEPPVLPKIEQMRNANGAEFRTMAQAVLDFRAALVERKQAETQIYQLAFFDPLTHLPNRRLLVDRLQQALALSARSGRHGALLFLDLDNFKAINDTKGHDVGDLLLVEVGKRIESCIREGDTVARTGGDEFVVLVESLKPWVADAAAQAELVAGNIREVLNRPYVINDYTHYISPSIGIAMFKGHQERADDLLKYVDAAMYQAKTAGRNAVRFYDPALQVALEARADMESELRRALEAQQFELHYQVQVDCQLRPLGAEALLRWQHPERGMISPGLFIPLAEETGLIVPIGLWVLQTACARLKAWESDELTRDLKLAVNVSARQFRQADFVAQVRQVLRDSGARSSQLKLELTESMVVDNVDDTIAKMRELKQLGVSFSMDDFGTGYSSLQYLKQLPLDQIKIDQSFVRDITSNGNDATIVHTIIAMGDAMGLDVIAEGVETEVQRAFLDEHGCHAYQGYLFGRPVPSGRFEAALRDMQKSPAQSNALP